MSKPSMRPKDSQRGFSLMEIMVGVAIGLIGIVVMFQTIEVWEARKRTTSSGSDAQVAGTLAMFALERDLKLAGYGYGQSINFFMGAPLTIYDALRTPTTFTTNVYPVQITDGAAGAPDTISVFWGNSSFLTAKQSFTASTNTTKRTEKSRTGFQLGDVAMVCGIVGTNQCTLVEITDNTAADGLTLKHEAVGYTNFAGQPATARYNPGTSPFAYTLGTLYNLGPRPQMNTWQITNGKVLTWSDALHSEVAPTEVGEGIIDLQAQYGTATDSDGDGIMDSTTWSAAAPANWNLVQAVRVALLARGQQFEKPPVVPPIVPVTPNAPKWGNGAFTFQMRNVDGTADTNPTGAQADNNWRNYRYRVYEQVIPLRNIIWGGIQ
jgi:type IV pilus assembly protein PilW